MTKEEHLEIEAEKYVYEKLRLDKGEQFKYAKKIYLAGAKPREKRIAELEQQIEKMKRYLDCEYCEHYTQPRGCKNCNEEIRSDWKLKEIKEK